MDRKDWYRKTVPFPYHLMKIHTDDNRLYKKFYTYVFTQFFGKDQYKLLYNSQLTRIPFHSSDVWVTMEDGAKFKSYTHDMWQWLNMSPADFTPDVKWAKSGKIYIRKLHE